MMDGNIWSIVESRRTKYDYLRLKISQRVEMWSFRTQQEGLTLDTVEAAKLFPIDPRAKRKE